MINSIFSAPKAAFSPSLPLGLAALVAGLGMAPAAFAQTDEALETPASIDRAAKEERSTGYSRTRIFLGPALSPAYPGADRLSWGPYLDFSRAREGEYFAFEAPDEGIGFNVIEKNGSALGISANMVGRRKAKDVDGLLPSVDRSVELGLSGQTWVTDNIRLRAEARKAVSGHKGFVGNISADYVYQSGDEWLLSLGPRLSLGDGKFHRTYYGVTAEDSLRSGLPVTRPKGGLHGVGVAASVLHQFDENWGVAAYAGYEYLVGDAGSSPVTKAYGSRHQPSVGIALSYSFARGK